MTTSRLRPESQSPLTLTLLNGDSSWLIEIDGTRLLLDPWLEGAAIIGHPSIHLARFKEDASPWRTWGRCMPWSSPTPFLTT